jgi:hypothetical protein
VELVGPAGAGKSTIGRMLSRVEPSFRPPMTAWDLSPWMLAVHAVRELPTFARSGRPSQLQLMCVYDLVRILALCARLRQADLRRYQVVLLDEGPVFLLTRLLAYEPVALQSAALRARWEHALRRCATAVDELVWIDAPDPELARRIRSRAKPHRLKAASDAEISTFSTRYRKAFRKVTSVFADHHGPRVSRFTADEPLPRTAARIARALRSADVG